MYVPNPEGCNPSPNAQSTAREHKARLHQGCDLCRPWQMGLMPMCPYHSTAYSVALQLQPLPADCAGHDCTIPSCFIFIQRPPGASELPLSSPANSCSDHQLATPFFPTEIIVLYHKDCLEF